MAKNAFIKLKGKKGLIFLRNLDFSISSHYIEDLVIKEVMVLSIIKCFGNNAGI